MGRIRVTYHQITCDYPDHGFPNELRKSDYYHLVDGSKVVCEDCWDNRMTVEKLLAIMAIAHQVTQVGQEQ